MGVLLGVPIRYKFRTRSGSEGWAEISEARRTILVSEEVFPLAPGSLSIARDLVENRDVITDVLGKFEDVARLRPGA